MLVHGSTWSQLVVFLSPGHGSSSRWDKNTCLIDEEVNLLALVTDIYFLCTAEHANHSQEYMEKINSHKHQAAVSLSPRLIRSRSASPAISLPDSRPIFRDSSKSTAKLKSSCRAEPEKLNHINTQKKVIQDDSDKFLRRSKSKTEVPRKARSASASPSAWALSPGRLPPPLPMASPVQATVVPKSPITTGKLKREFCSKGKGVSGVLKYFRQKKVSPLQEEEYHQFRIMHNRLLQWRFANARAEVSMTAAKRNAEKKLFNVWARITMLRKLVVENKIQMQRLKQEIKLYRIVGLQMYLLKEWGRLEKKNFEAVGRLAGNLSAISVYLPLVQGAKADTILLDDTMCMATRVMESMEATITPMQSQVEKTCYLLTELSVVMKEQTDNVKKLSKLTAKIASLEAAVSSLKVHCIQLQSEG